MLDEQTVSNSKFQTFDTDERERLCIDLFSNKEDFSLSENYKNDNLGILVEEHLSPTLHEISELYRLGNIDSVIILAKLRLKNVKLCVQTLTLLSISYEKILQLEAAIDVLEIAVTLHPNTESLWARLASIYYKDGRRKKAISAY